MYPVFLHHVNNENIHFDKTLYTPGIYINGYILLFISRSFRSSNIGGKHIGSTQWQSTLHISKNNAQILSFWWSKIIQIPDGDLGRLYFFIRASVSEVYLSVERERQKNAKDDTTETQGELKIPLAPEIAIYSTKISYFVGNICTGPI